MTTALVIEDLVVEQGHLRLAEAAEALALLALQARRRFPFLYRADLPDWLLARISNLPSYSRPSRSATASYEATSV